MENDSASEENSPLDQTLTQLSGLSGRWVVLAMVGFGVVLTAVLWGYWKLHTSPFLPLQQAVAEAYPDSAPLVQGGQRKMHKGTPRILRITMRVDFDPNAESAAARVDAIVDKLYDLADETLDLSRYDQLEVHLFRKLPEQESQMVTIVRPISEDFR